MKSVMMGLFVLITFTAISQAVQTKAVVRESKLEITYNKTTNLVFPEAIASVDRGSRDVLVQKAVGAENVLRVKADVKGFAETNLSVITASGKLYSFIVVYSDSPSELNITVGIDYETGSISKELPIESASFIKTIKTKRGNIRSIEDESSKVSMELQGFYVKDDLIFCKLKMKNRSRIDYDVDQFHLYIRDKKKSKRTASQEIVVTPVSFVGDSGTLRSKTSRVVIIAMPKFTIPDGKFFNIEMMERNGGRNLFLRAGNRHLMKAKAL